jgi:hypothetical protein
LDIEGGEAGFFVGFFLMLKLYKHKVATCPKYPQMHDVFCPLYNASFVFQFDIFVHCLFKDLNGKHRFKKHEAALLASAP